jgi:peptidyl-prolyl cis-trans isomerase A (cyclophilin A)
MSRSRTSACVIGVCLTVIFAAMAAGLSPQATTQSAPPSTAPAPQASALEYVLFTTDKGAFLLELNREMAPLTVANFLKYVDDKFYDGTVFHRVTNAGIFVIQGGGYNADGSKKPTRAPIKNEWQNGLKNDRGTISMARTAVADSATSQFFLNVYPNPVLDEPRDGAAYAVFGKVVTGMKVIDDIHGMPAMGERPANPVKVETARHISADDAKKLIDAEKQAEADKQPAAPKLP